MRLQQQTNPFPLSRPLDEAAVGDAGLRQSVVADEAERIALAQSAGLVAIGTLSAELRIRREGRHGLRVTGEIKSVIRQTCVVSLEAFDSDVAEPVDVRFLPEADIEAEAARRAKLVSTDDEVQEDLPDPIVRGRIDLGALVAELLVLALDPYPKKPGTCFAPPQAALEEDAVVSPFAVLGRLKSP